MPDFLPFALSDISQDEINKVLDSLRSGWLTTGLNTKRFGEEFAAVNSAIARLHLALEAAGICSSDEVITVENIRSWSNRHSAEQILGACNLFYETSRELNL